MHKFDSFDERRKKQLINAGFHDFSEHGYKRASLNRMLQEADIPKGVFYHYFKNKEEWYHYLVQYGINVITKKMMNSVILEESDYIKRMLLSYKIKVEAYKEYQYFEKFLMKVYSENNQEFIASISLEESKDYGQRFIHENIDQYKFRVDDLDANIRIISRYMQQVFNDIIHSIQHMSKLDIETYLQKEAHYLITTLYKEEYHD